MLQNVLLKILLLLSVTANILFVSWLYYQYRQKDQTINLTNTELLQQTIELDGNKTIGEFSQPINAKVLQANDTLNVSFNLHGLCALNGNASALVLVATNGKQYSVPLSNYARNCYDGEQTAIIPLSDFFGERDTYNANKIRVTFWYPTQYRVTIASILANKRVLGTSTVRRSTKNVHQKLTPTQTITPTIKITPIITPTLTPLVNTSWPIQSVSSMKETKDKVCNQRSAQFIGQWVVKAKELGVNYIAIETPYDNPTCGDSVSYTRTWIDIIRSQGLHVWHRHMPLAFEGIYNTPKNISIDYLALIANYIKNHPDFFQAGDIFTPIPEPQNGGISGVTYCPQSSCIFNGTVQFNQWLRDAIDTSENAFSSIGLAKQMKIGYYGFDGFVAWGDNNPDWSGILEDTTVQKMGNITIDHYPEIVGDTMQNDLNELQAKYPNTPIVIGEWGTISGGDVEQQVLQSMGAAKRPNVVGFMYWHLGMGGNEALINDDFTNRVQFDEVQSFFKP